MLNLDKLRHCVVVAEQGSFSRAATMLSVPQSVLSRQVRDIEALFGVALLRRTGRGAVLTDAGAALLPRLRGLVADGDALLEEARRFHRRPSGTVRLGMLTALTPVLLTPLLKQAAAELPDVRLTVMDGLTHHLDELVVSGRLDLAILYKERLVPQPTDAPLLHTDLYLVGAAGDPVTRAATIKLAALAALSLTLPALPNRMRLVINQVCRQHGVALNVTTVLDSVGALKELAAGGTTYTILPPYFVAAEVAAGRLQASRIVGPKISRTVLLASATQGPMGVACTAVAALVRDVTTRMVRSGELAADLAGPATPRTM